jgi:DNA-binding response OmpR family regulator
MSILLADDDPVLATSLSKFLESEGYSVHTALDENTMLAELYRQNYKLIILDLNFGVTDGLHLLEKLRSDGVETPVIVVSARTKPDERIHSLHLGADDYVTKPCHYAEVAARVEAVLRRKSDPSLRVLRVEDLELDPARRKVRRGKREIRLSPTEFGLLQLLMAHAGETVERQTLLKETWGTQETDSNLVDVYVNYLRKKVDSFSAEKLIQTVRRIGYRLGPPAPTGGGFSGDVQPGAQRPPEPKKPAPKNSVLTATAAQSAIRALIHSLGHDIAQPLTTVRGYLELLALNNGTPVAADLTTMRWQTERAIALGKGVSALARNSGPATGTWISVEQLLTDLLNEFSCAISSGLLTVERRWEASVQVTSSTALFQLLVFFVSKLIGFHSQPLTLAISAQALDGICDLELQWRPTSPDQSKTVDAASILSRDRIYIKEIADLIGGELGSLEEQPQIKLKAPAPLANAAGPGIVQ